MKTAPRILALALLASGSLHARSIVGSWYANIPGKDKSKLVITFLPNGIFLVAEDGVPELDLSGMPGMERGTYKWNSTTTILTSKTLVDTSGEWGLSGDEKLKVSVSGSTLTLDESEYKKVTSRKSKLVGSWYLKQDGGYAILTFNTDGSYFMAQDGKAGGGGKTGMERGTYKWNTSTKALTIKVLVDTNGTWGLSDNAKREISISGRTLSLKVAGEGIFKLKKVAK